MIITDKTFNMHKLRSLIGFGLLLLCTWLQSCSNDDPQQVSVPAVVTKDSLQTKVPDEFIDLLFADQSIDQLDKIASAKTIGNKSVWTDFVGATQLASQRKTDGAIAAFKAIADNKENEPRVRLWAWNGLRELGVHPPHAEVLGLILEVPQQGSTEFLAIYADNSARYINYTGMVVVWQEQQQKMDSLIRVSLADARQIVDKLALTKGRVNSRTGSIRFSFLTTDGLLQAEKEISLLNDPKDPFTRIFAGGAQMLGIMVNKAQQTGKK